MRRSLGLLGSAILLFAALFATAVPVMAADGDPGEVRIVQHACTEQPVRTQAAFDAIVAKADGDAETALALTVMACPTIVLPAHEATRTDGVVGPAVAFEYEVTDADGVTQTLDDATFVAAGLCESDLDRDVNGDGQSSPDVCFDTSHYVFRDLAVGDVTVRESRPPNGWRFGTRLLDPVALQPPGSDDAATGAAFDAATGTVTLDLVADPDNGAALHIYDFEDSPATDTLPAEPGLPIAPLAGIALLVVAAGARVRHRRTT